MSFQKPHTSKHRGSANQTDEKKRKKKTKTEPRLPGITVKLLGNHLFHALLSKIKNTQTCTEQIVSLS